MTLYRHLEVKSDIELRRGTFVACRYISIEQLFVFYFVLNS